MTDETTKIQVTLNADTYKALRETSREERRSIAQLIREGVEMRLKQSGREIDTYVPPGGRRADEGEE